MGCLHRIIVPYIGFGLCLSLWLTPTLLTALPLEHNRPQPHEQGAQHTAGDNGHASALRADDPIEATLLTLRDIELFWRGDSLGDPPKECLNPDGSIIIPSTLELEYRLAEINRRAPMRIMYHDRVARYVRIYLVERRAQVEQMLGLAKLYFPLFREALDRYRLPLELVWLPVVESALNPLAVSKSGAVGLWQFKLNTAEMFNLHVDSFVDERVDPKSSTEAACLYLQYLYKLFDDWELALAAYNAGPGTVQRAVQRSGGERDLWKLEGYLPEAPLDYVAAFNAVAYIFTHAEQHGFKAHPPLINFQEVDTVQVQKPVSFSILSQWTNIPLELLHFLNPQYRQGYLPHPDAGKSARLVLPKASMEQYVAHSARIFAQSHKVSESPFPQAEEELIKVQHVVAKGEYLHRIALLYGCTVDNLRGWNSLSQNGLQPGQILQVWVTPAKYALVQKNNGGGR